MPEKLLCPYCKGKIKKNDKFCPKCGKPIKEKPSGKVNAKKKNRINNKVKISLIALGSFLGALLMAFIGFILYVYYGPPGQYYRQYIELIQSGRSSYVQESPHFGNLQISSEIDGTTFEPLDQQDEFRLGFREVFATIYVSGVSTDDEFTFIWKDKDAEEVIIDYTFKYFIREGYIPNYISIPPEKNLEDFKIFGQPGTYIIEYYHNGQLIDSEDFTVIEDQTVTEQETAIQEGDTAADTSQETMDSTEITNSDEDGQPGLWFSNLLTCEAADRQGPVSPREIFEYGTGSICSTLYVSGATIDDGWMFIWKTGSGETAATYAGKYSPMNGESTKEFIKTCIFIPEGGDVADNDILGQPGMHAVEFYHNGELIDTAVFSIENDKITAFGDLYVCEPLVEPKAAPFIVREEFKAGIPEIIATIYFYGVDPSDEFEFIFLSIDKKEIIGEYKNNYPLDEGYIGISSHITEEYSPHYVDIVSTPGEYLVEFYHNGEFISKYTFYIVR